MPAATAKNAFHLLRKPILLGLTLLALALVLSLLTTFQGMSLDDDLLVESTLGQLALWMAEQSGNEPEDISSPLARYADHWANELGAEELDPTLLLNSMRSVIVIWCGLLACLLLLALLTLWMRPSRSQAIFFVSLLLLDVMLFIIPTVGGSQDPVQGQVLWLCLTLFIAFIGLSLLRIRRTLVRMVFFVALLLLAALLYSPLTAHGINTFSLILCAILTLLAALLTAPGKISRVFGFFVALSVLMLVWESSKAFADAIQYKIVLPQASWSYETLPSLDDALAALAAGEVDYVIADRKDLDDWMPPHPPRDKGEAEELAWENLRYLANLDRAEGLGPLPILPAFPGRLSVALRADEAKQVNAVRDIFGRDVATVAGEFADTKFLPTPRSLVLFDLKILNDLNLPHLQMIAEAFLQPARRNGEWLLLRILGDAGLYTFSEAIYGFIFGALLGFVLGAVFAHSPLMERGLLPYVVASQTVPILAIAPMVVIWLGASQLSVAVIAAYLTFFPVTINTLRGLQSPDVAQIELMRSYASTRWTIMWKLRFPAALPYIFTALKVSATASVVGAIIGELPSGIGAGLGRAILDFSSDYSLISTPKLWASIVMAAAVGILFFLSVNVAERLVLRRYIHTAD